MQEVFLSLKQHCAIGQHISISSYSCKRLEYRLQNRVANLPMSTFVCWSLPSKLFQSMTFVLFVAGNCRDLGWQQRYARFCGRIVVLSVLVLLLYPFLWVWTVIGTLWFSTARGCLPEEGQKWGFLIWLLFSYCGLACIACVAVGKVLL
jgi:hypothetical protein